MNPEPTLDPPLPPPTSEASVALPPPPVGPVSPARAESLLPRPPEVIRWRQPWRRTGDVLGRLAIGLLAANVLVHLANIALELHTLKLLDRGEVERLAALSGLLDGLAWLAVLTYLATAVVFAGWLRMLWRSDRSDPSQHQLSDGMAVGGWFIPVANVVFGGKALTQLWHGVNAARTRDLGTARDLVSTPPLIVAWWVGWVLMAVLNVAQRSAGRSLDRAEAPDAIVAATESLLGVDAWASGITAATGALLIVVVLRVMGMVRR